MRAFNVTGSQRMKAVLGQPLSRHKYVFLLISFFQQNRKHEPLSISSVSFLTGSTTPQKP